jgi:hypothetical protein
MPGHANWDINVKTRLFEPGKEVNCRLGTPTALRVSNLSELREERPRRFRRKVALAAVGRLGDVAAVVRNVRDRVARRAAPVLGLMCVPEP